MKENGTVEMKIGCVIMASGKSVRFGTNKLLADFCGKSLIQHVLDLTEGDLFAKRVVVTRCREVESLCVSQGIEVIFHEKPDRNDTVRLGISKMEEMDGCLFCPCDQPLLKRESLEELVKTFMKNDLYQRENGMFRLAAKERPGTPVLFGKKWFDALKNLPQKCGGGYLVKLHPEHVQSVWIQDEHELWDVDTQEDLENMINLNGNKGGS